MTEEFLRRVLELHDLVDLEIAGGFTGAMDTLYRGLRAKLRATTWEEYEELQMLDKRRPEKEK